MTEANINPEGVETVKTTTSTETKPGPFTTLLRSIKHNPVRSTLALAAAGGAGTFAYFKMRDGTIDGESAVEAVEQTAELVATIFG